MPDFQARAKIIFSACLLFPLLFACKSADSNEEALETTSMGTANEPEPADLIFRIADLPEEKKIEIYAGEDLFTAYIYPDNIAKPILYPLRTVSGKKLSRGFPLEPAPGERADHPHHIGHWLNYGDVNGLDFWNNSEAIPEERRKNYGFIRHQRVAGSSSEKGRAELKIDAQWETPAGVVLLDEKTVFVFSQSGNNRIIDRTTTLKARDQKVNFNDNKEGMVAVRVARQLELPAEKPLILIDAQGRPAKEKKLDNTGVLGNYLSSEGLEGNEVWGTRAKWVKLYSRLEGEPVSITIMDHPDNVGYPTYWHARDYGLFSANPLGQKVFSKGKEELNFALEAGEAVTFRYQIVLHSGDVLSPDQIEQLYRQFTK